MNKQYLWENGQWGYKNFYGLQNPHADYHYNRILFLPEKQLRRGVLVCWVNVQERFKVDVFVNNKEYKTYEEARDLWINLTDPGPNVYSAWKCKPWIRNDDVPPRKIHPDDPGSGWGKAPRETSKYSMINHVIKKNRTTDQ